MKRILIVEDEEGLLDGLAHNFRYEGYDVLTAKNGQEGLRLALKQKPDAVLLDIMLPEKDGFTVLKELFESGAAQPLGEASLFTGQMEQNPKWLNGDIGFTIDWSGTINKYKESIGAENFTVAKPPFAADGDNQKIQMKPSMVLAVSNRSKNVEAATQYANWMMTDPDAAAILGTQRSVPTSQAAFIALQAANAIDTDVASMVAFTNANPAAPVPLVQSNTEIADMVKDICEQVVYGTATPEEAAAKFMVDIAKQLQAIQPAS